MTREPNLSVIAAVDLGSNSFHMIVAELRHGQLIVLDRLRETVRLAEGLRKKKGLTAAARIRALECLARFGERLRDMHAESVRAAGTNTLRRTRRDTGFLAAAEETLGHPIEVISGLEEARLIYLGVAHSLPPGEGRRLVLDIGGGSTEIILGEGFQSHELKSLSMGCVGITERYFPNGRITGEAMREARLRAQLRLRPIKAYFRKAEWREAIGASGTIRSAETVARELGWLQPGGVTRDNLEQLIGLMIEKGHIDRLDLPGLSQRRAQVWPGGLAILAELMATLRVDAVRVADGALREGLLYDLVGRIRREDARERSVTALTDRYHIDRDQAGRVEETAMKLLDAVAGRWKVDDEARARRLLGWAARLHEIGLDISHADFHLHGAYVLRHGDLPGFSRLEQIMLAYLVATQRKKPRRAMDHDVPESRAAEMERLAALLRIAVLLQRSRSSAETPEPEVTTGKRKLALRFPEGWLAANPLSLADLERERDYLEALNLKLEFS